MKERAAYLNHINEAFVTHPSVAILGPRQCGKTTLARMFVKGKKATIFDLEDPRDLQRLSNPMLALENLSGLIVIDEIQRKPDLFPILRVLIDNKELSQQFLILGSASRNLIKQSSETLAGRITYLELTPFTLQEVGDMNKLWLRGGYPLSFLAESRKASISWLQSYITTYLEQDIPNLGFRVPPTILRRFWLMLAHYHAQLFNSSELGRALGISSTAIRNYLGILAGTFMIRELKPWIEHNIKKRQVKSPKIYFRDPGIYHSLIGVDSFEDLQKNPKIGASWEGFALEEVIKKLNIDGESCFFWRTHAGAELDLFVNSFGKRQGFEFKYSDAPKVTPSMRAALDDLELEFLTVIFPGKHEYALAENVHAVGLSRFISRQYPFGSSECCR